MSRAPTWPARVLRGEQSSSAGLHRFATVTELSTVAAGRPVRTGDRVVDGIRYSAWEEGLAAGLEEGRREGSRLGYEEGRFEGFEAGRSEGRASAREEALSELRAELAGVLDALEAAAADLAKREAVVLAEIEAGVVELALGLASAVLESEVAVAEDPGREALRRALALVPDGDDLVVRLSPQDLTALEASAGLDQLAPGRSVTLVADPEIGRGGCLVEAGAARVDARIERALARAREVLSP